MVIFSQGFKSNVRDRDAVGNQLGALERVLVIHGNKFARRASPLSMGRGVESTYGAPLEKTVHAHQYQVMSFHSAKRSLKGVRAARPSEKRDQKTSTSSE